MLQDRRDAGLATIYEGLAAPHHTMAWSAAEYRFTFRKSIQVGSLKMSKFVWEEIHAFQSLSEYQRFVEYIESQVRAGHAIEVPADPRYQKGEVYGGRWFEDPGSGEIWRLVSPDFPFRGLWERVTGET
jgi:hypothetical protein